MSNGHVERGWLGVQIQGVTRELAESLDLPEAKGALVARVVDGSPASAGGISTGDVIVKFDNRDVGEAKDLSRMVAGISAGQKVEIMVWRNGKQKSLEVSIGHGEAATPAVGSPVKKPSEGRLGLSLAPMTPDIRARYQVGDEVSGSVVVAVEDDGPADSVGVRPGDVIVQVANQPVNGPHEVAKTLAGVSKDTKRVVLLINRRGDQWFVPVELG
jgi:serine protease Do